VLQLLLIAIQQSAESSIDFLLSCRSKMVREPRWVCAPILRQLPAGFGATRMRLRIRGEGCLNHCRYRHNWSRYRHSSFALPNWHPWFRALSPAARRPIRAATQYASTPCNARLRVRSARVSCGRL